jgi:hypothetical protein
VVAGVQARLVATGRGTRGRLGVSIQALDLTLARAFGMDTPQGALVTGVEPDCPAAQAGLRTGDVIVSVEFKPIGRSAELPVMVATLKPDAAIAAPPGTPRATFGRPGPIAGRHPSRPRDGPSLHRGLADCGPYNQGLAAESFDDRPLPTSSCRAFLLHRRARTAPPRPALG